MMFFTVTGIVVWGCVAIIAIWYATGRMEISIGKGEKDD
jgi:hypothetical protein